jgi:hypothetical protein
VSFSASLTNALLMMKLFGSPACFQEGFEVVLRSGHGGTNVLPGGGSRQQARLPIRRHRTGAPND